MAVGRLQAALASATSEVTVAAANLNFDFTLVKYEAPKEYQPLGGILSAKRKENAELGSSHVLARQLGALFTDVCPSTPDILEAYGKRVSEIAKVAAKASDPYTDTLFGDYTGIDGTSIWAAATSSNSAIYVHLLATLLARMWTAPEAVAIWVELVAERKKDIAQRLEEGKSVHFSLAAAVGQDITRTQLAAWDTSARAWLRTADEVFKSKQKQLQLVLKNIDLPVNVDSKVFPSVIEAWVIAVETTNNLILGRPQAVQNGAALLGLSAWHIYPDMGIFSPRVVEVKMNDSLVAAGGVLSIGLATTPHNSGEGNGVYWSLSLAQLRFYGRPVKVERAVQAGSRITFSQLSLVIFGVILADWRTSSHLEEQTAKAIRLLVDYVSGRTEGSANDKRFLRLLRDSALSFNLRESGDNKKLIQLGVRRSQRLIYGIDGFHKRERIHPLFGLLEPSNLLSLLKDVEARIRFLRYIVGRMGTKLNADDLIIRCATRTHESPWHYGKGVDSHHDFDSRSDYSESSSSGASHKDQSLPKRNGAIAGSMQEDDTSTHSDHHSPSGELVSGVEGINMAEITESPKSPSLSIGDFSLNGLDSGDESEEEEEAEPKKTGGSMFHETGIKYMYATAMPFSLGSATGNTSLEHHRWTSDTTPSIKFEGQEAQTFDANEKFRSWVDSIQIIAAEDPEQYLYSVLLGNPDETALFARRAKFPEADVLAIDLEDFIWCLDHDLIDPVQMLQWLSKHQPSHDRLCDTLKVLAAIAAVYDDLPESTVDVGILDRPLLDTRWVFSAFHPVRSGSRRSIAFSMIAYCESGKYDVDPHELGSVIALSSENSLFVCRALLEDPYKCVPNQTGICRIPGNVGKPGLTFLLPAQEPMMRDIDPSSWKVDSYRKFDGTTARSFDCTSLHLSFTDYHVPLFDGSRGGHDNQISFLESVISVRDKGQWIADVDPLPLLNVHGFRQLEVPPVCQHAQDSAFEEDITAVDSWNEVLDNPDGVFVIRAGDNHIARLALSLVAYQHLQKTYETFAVTICPSKVCWACIRQSFRHHAFIF